MDEGEDKLIGACADMVGRTGAEAFSVEYVTTESELTVWLATATYGDRFEVGASSNPITAVLRLVETIIDGGMCAHCGRMTTVDPNWQNPVTDLPGMDAMFCAYVYDPSTAMFVRGCAENDESPGPP